MFPYNPFSPPRRLPGDVVEKVHPIFMTLAAFIAALGLTQMALGDFGGLICLIAAFLTAAVLVWPLASSATLAMVFSLIAFVDSVASCFAVIVPAKFSWYNIPDATKPLASCYILSALFTLSASMWHTKVSYKFDSLQPLEDAPLLRQAFSPPTTQEIVASSGIVPFSGEGHRLGSTSSAEATSQNPQPPAVAAPTQKRKEDSETFTGLFEGEGHLLGNAPEETVTADPETGNARSWWPRAFMPSPQSDATDTSIGKAVERAKKTSSRSSSSSTRRRPPLQPFPKPPEGMGSPRPFDEP